MRYLRIPGIVLAAAVLAVTSLGATVSAAAPTNDDWADATRIASLAFKHSGNNQAATSEPREDTIVSCGPSAGLSVWYRFTPAKKVTVRVVVTGNFDVSLRLMVGNSLDSLQDVACSDRGATGTKEWLARRLRKGFNYYIRIDSGHRAGGFGDYSLKVRSQKPANDFIGDAIKVRRFPYEDTAGNRYATVEHGPPFGTRGSEPRTSHDFDCDLPVRAATRTTWYRVKPTRKMLVRALLKGRFDLRMTLFEGGSPRTIEENELDCGASTGSGLLRVWFLRTLLPGHTYWFQVASEGKAWGRYTFKVTQR